MPARPSTTLLFLLTGIVLSALQVGCTARGDSPHERRANILEMRDDVMTRLYRERPEVRGILEEAAGHGAFSNIGTKLIFVSAGGGYGVVEDHLTGRQTFMRMGELGVGLGLGVRDFRAVFVFHDVETMRRFVTRGWEFGAEADATFQSSERGGSAVAAGSLTRGLSVYQVTESGIALSATVGGTRYWRDDELNER